MEYFFRCNGNFIIHMEKILHEIDSIWKNYYIIKFPWNKYYARTNILSLWNVILTSRDAKIKSRGFPILASHEVNITFQRVLWNDQN